MTIVQNRPTQFDMPLYALMQDSDDWNLQVIYTEVDAAETEDHELGRAPLWDHIPAGADRGIYLNAAERSNPRAVADRITAHQPGLALLYRP